MPLVTVGAAVRRDVNRVQEKSFEHVSPFGKVQFIASAVGAKGTTPAKFHRDTSRVQPWFDLHTRAGKVRPLHLRSLLYTVKPQRVRCNGLARGFGSQPLTAGTHFFTCAAAQEPSSAAWWYSVQSANSEAIRQKSENGVLFAPTPAWTAQIVAD